MNLKLGKITSRVNNSEKRDNAMDPYNVQMRLIFVEMM